MNDRTKRWRAGGFLVLGLGLAACGGKGAPPPRAIAIPAPSPASEVDAILALLDQGDGETARKRVAAALKRDPMDASLQVLRDSLDRDPVDLLGPTNYSYTVRPGDTMTGLAERLLGNRLKSYQLARYNGVEKPAELAPGRVLRIPGNAPVARKADAAEPRRDAKRRPDAPARPALATPKARSTPGPAATVAKSRAADPGGARAARAAGLAALNQGQVSRAVGLLRRAATLDPANPLVGRDLARAERIASTVRARR
ncbi:MAG TPA: LysM domain-containing protein [Sphingomonas sp.]|uniref:LysM peptidoglycan-binding domain-containing protein n=1 Tax=Sphingomonas sp. TaxID=28214 RepID=UPI002ED9D67E